MLQYLYSPQPSHVTWPVDQLIWPYSLITSSPEFAIYQPMCILLHNSDSKLQQSSNAEGTCFILNHIYKAK